ncbi:DUF6318 family protein [Ornithinimicrobium pekingense]|uniref:DUF6318 domain-containing protein n=1 Tax=Ornithinimicrobium pekingense TaxID=384677 RepID=A0ABQ2FA87_9MICO|nr:DUF6318 family protein [Ornithinimicrobium pekingense]GGK67812.1 hypothetical protein GCM10011509_15230 [Ornithinimicrobium pekingense]
MTRSVITAAVCLAVLAGCGGTPEPSPPPTSEDALTTATAEPDVVEETTEAAPTTEAPEETAAPEMPEEAREQTEAGAEAFALHYIDLVNYTGMDPQSGLLEPLAADGCDSCENHEATVLYSEQHDETLTGELWTPNAVTSVVHSDEQAVIRVPVEQHAVDVLNNAGEVTDTTDSGQYVLVFELEPADPWLVRGIQVEEP